ncbi:MAG TPA: hypothetical protein VIG99_06580 [Myxococcaceae bacterium]
MGMLRRISATAALLCGGLALAAPNDFHIQLLGNPADPDPSRAATANANFRAFAKEMGAALASSYLTPPGTLGHSGFAVAAELSVISLKGVTPGEPTPTGPFFVMPTERAYSGTSLLPGVHVRKGLPWSFEIGTKVGWIDRSDMAVATMEVKWAGNEGFAYLPDVSARFHATRLFNTRDFELGVNGLDFSVGKKWAIGGMITLTPYGGWDLTFVGASTNRLVDFNEGRTEAQAYASQFAQFSNSGAYKEVAMFENAHNRFYGGVRFVGGVIQIIAEVSAAGLGSITIPGTNLEMQLPPVLAFNVSLGLDF